MSQNNKFFVFIIMVWFTIITIWAVSSVTSSINNQSVNVQGVPVQSTPQQITSIQMDKDTVWVIDPNSNYIRVITHDNEGYHITGSEMSFQER